MYFTTSFVGAALLGLSAASTHPYEAVASSAPAHQAVVSSVAHVVASPPPAHQAVQAVSSAAHEVVATSAAHVVVATSAAHVVVATSAAHVVVASSPPAHQAVQVVSSAAHEVVASSAAHVAVSSVAHVVATSVVHDVVASSVIAASETLHVAPTYHEAVASTSAEAAVASGEATVNTHVIQVGGPAGELIFAPNNIVAAPGDLVQFQFNPKNHSVVQSTFDQPCIPIQNVLANKTDAFFSGFMPVSAAAGNATGKVDTLTYTIRVMDSKPVWFYCSQGKHCQSGMVGAINAPATGNKTMEGFTALAAVALENLSPGQASGGSPAVSSVAPGAPQSSGFVASATVSGAASTTTSTGPLQNSVAAAPGNLARQSFFGLGLGGLAAFLVL